MPGLITIDGTVGEGGGQVLRTALSLSLVTGRPFRIADIRGRRKKPGLLAQHLTAVRAAAEIGEAETVGASKGSTELSFLPTARKSGTYHFNIGTAGSCTLVLQTILPALITAGGDTEVVLEGGTHNPFAPTFDFFNTTFVPLINSMGPHITALLERPGFYPAGGGRIRVRVKPASSLAPLELTGCTNLSFQARVICAGLPEHIAQRELKSVTEELGIPGEATETIQYEQYGPGNVVSIFGRSDQLVETFTAHGKKRLRAEKVAAIAVEQARVYRDIGAPVGPYLADQLLLPMALAGKGLLLTCRPTSHTRTNIEVISRFLDHRIIMNRVGEKLWTVAVG